MGKTDDELKMKEQGDEYVKEQYGADRFYLGSGVETRLEVREDGAQLVKLSPSEVWFCERMVAHHGWPYRNVAEVVNDAMVHRFHQLGMLVDDDAAGRGRHV